jgi:hypothetical protein
MPYFLQHYATGKLFSASMPTESLLALHNKVIKKTPLDNQKESDNQNIQQIQNNNTEYSHDYAILDDIKQILLDEVDEDQQRNVTLTKMKQLRTKYEFNVQTEVFHEWILENLTNNNWKHALGTGNRYLNAIDDVWIKTWQDVNILEAGSDDMDVLFEYMVEQRIDRDSTVRETLFLLFKFIGSRYTIAIPESISDNLKSWHVRSEFIPEHFYEQLRVDLQSRYSNTSESYQLTIDVMLIFLRRGFFRPSELFKITMSDLESSRELWVRLRKNIFGRLKSFSATRKVPVGILLKPNEVEIIEHFISIRKVETEGRENALLFSQQTNHNIIFESKIFLPHITELLSSYAGHRIVSYQFRHSGISNIQLVLFSDYETAIRYTGYSESQILEIRQYFETHNNDLYAQLSSTAGHLSSRTTITTYSHFTDLILGQCLNKTQFQKPLRFWVNLSGISATRILNNVKSSNVLNDKVKSIDIAIFFDDELKEFSVSASKSAEKINSGSVILKTLFTPKIVHCERILAGYDSGKTAEDIAKALTLPQQYVIAVIESAKSIRQHHSYQTNRGKSRLINSSIDSIRPNKMTTKLEDADRLKIYQHLLVNYKNQHEVKKQIMHHILSTTSCGHSYVSFNSVEHVALFIEFFHPIINKDRWYISIQPNTDLSGIEKWKYINDKVHHISVSDKTKKNKKMFPIGQAHLYLMHPNASDIIDKRPKQKMNKYATSSLKRACHWVAIHLKSKKLFEE